MYMITFITLFDYTQLKKNKNKGFQLHKDNISFQNILLIQFPNQ